jgi:hypothetical protein
MTAQELGCRMDALEFTDWLAFYDKETEAKTLQDLSTMVEHDLTTARHA